MTLSRHKTLPLPIRLWHWVRNGLAWMGAAVLAGMLLSLVLFSGPHVTEGPMILTYRLEGALPETQEGLHFGKGMFKPATTFYDLIFTLHRAAEDERVKALVLRIDSPEADLAQVQELRRAVEKFRAADKPALVFSDDMGMHGGGIGAYYLASAFSEIWLQPVGSVALGAIALELPFFKNTLDKLGIEADLVQQGRFKSAGETFERTDMSEESRSQMHALLQDMEEQILRDTATARGMDIAHVKTLMSGALYTDKEAMEHTLVDKLGYYDELLRGLQDTFRVTEDNIVAAEDYIPPQSGGGLSDMLKDSPPAIALITGEGDITSGEGVHLSTGAVQARIDSNAMAAAFQEASEDESIGAIVLRLSTPGGSPAASETIRRAIEQAQKKGKKVIVSMGGYTASGGYWIASAADVIVAEEGSITGSIGVFGGKPVLTGLWQKLGVTWDSINAAGEEQTPMWSTNRKFSEDERARFAAVMDRTYEAFLERVQEGRKMDARQVQAVAEGRVFTGRQAKARGLVDTLGGFDAALAAAKTAMGVDPDQPVDVFLLPAEKTPMELLREFFMNGALLPSLDLHALLARTVRLHERILLRLAL